MLLPLGNPFKCHEEVLSSQPLIPPKRFDNIVDSRDSTMLERDRFDLTLEWRTENERTGAGRTAKPVSPTSDSQAPWGSFFPVQLPRSRSLAIIDCLLPLSPSIATPHTHNSPQLQYRADRVVLPSVLLYALCIIIGEDD